MADDSSQFHEDQDNRDGLLKLNLAAQIAGSFTFASYQNAVPVIRSIRIDNCTTEYLNNLKVEMNSVPAFLRAKIWTLDRLAPGDSIVLSDRKVDLDAGYLAGLNEAERGEITLRLSAAGETLSEQRFAVRLLARDEWGGVADMAQILPAFVMPNDPGVAPLLRSAAGRLAAHGHPGGLDGYQSGNPQRAFMLTAAIYSAIAGAGLHYAEPPASFESRGQKVRRPGTIAADRLATCLDTTLLFAAALEGAGLNPVILLFDGHAAVGVWLADKTFGNAIETDQMEVRKALASRELIVFETTGVTHRPAMTMEAAQRALDRRMAEDAAQAFVAAIDVGRSRSGGVMPLASHDARRPNAEPDQPDPSPDLPLPPPPDFSDLPGMTAEEKPTTAAGRIDRWQRKLLDLTLRNRLLNLPDTKKTIPFLCTDVGYLEDRLAAGAAIRVVSLPEQNPLGERDAALYRDVHGRDIQRGFAADALQRDELPSPLDARELAARLIELYRQVRNDFAEGGANTLFLAVGFLRWRKKPDDTRAYLAPLLLVPVKLDRRSASSTFTMRFHEDEPRFNATLLQFLECDFDLKIASLAGELPRDSSGIDVARVFAEMRKAIRDVPGMEVVDETALSTFSFAKFLMWKDLVERTDALRGNKVVRHLIDSPDRPFEARGGQPAFCDARDLDRVYAPANIVSLLPSDSSQTAASLAAAEGRDFVLVGPPGTGKSQTIANMIANCLAAGKTVLFVAEKTAALNVVHRRLRAHGLANHCIELHSNKSDRRHFLGQLKASWEHGGRADPAEWVAINERLRVRRDELNAYVDALHRDYPSGWTPFRALGIALRSVEAASPTFDWPGVEAQDTRKVEDLAQCAVDLGRVFKAVERRPALDLVDRGEWSSGWQESLLATGRSLQAAIDLFESAIEAFLASLGLDAREWKPRADVAALTKLAEALGKTRGHDMAIAFDRELAQCADALEQFVQSVTCYREAERGLCARYDEAAVRNLDADEQQRQWQEAQASWWPVSIMRKRKAQQRLQAHADHGAAKPDRDLPLLRRMQDALAGLDSNMLVGKALPMDGLATDVAHVAATLELAWDLRVSMAIPGLKPEEIRVLLQSIAPCLPATGAAAPPRRAAESRLRRRPPRFMPPAGIRRACAGATLTGLGQSDLAGLHAQISALVEARHLLRDWVAWRRARGQAIASGLAPLVDGLESGAIAPADAGPAFRLGYARWWLPKVIDSVPVLREFRRFQHENAVKDFREIDDLVRTQRRARDQRHRAWPAARAERSAQFRARLAASSDGVAAAEPIDPRHDRQDAAELSQARALHADVAALDRAVPAAEPGAVRRGDLRRGVADHDLGRGRRDRARRARRSSSAIPSNCRRPTSSAATRTRMMSPITRRIWRASSTRRRPRASRCATCVGTIAAAASR